MRALEGDVEVKKKKKKALTILTPKKLTEPTVLLAQIKAGNNSYKLKN